MSDAPAKYFSFRKVRRWGLTLSLVSTVLLLLYELNRSGDDA